MICKVCEEAEVPAANLRETNPYVGKWHGICDNCIGIYRITWYHVQAARLAEHLGVSIEDALEALRWVAAVEGFDEDDTVITHFESAEHVLACAQQSRDYDTAMREDAC